MALAMACFVMRALSPLFFLLVLFYGFHTARIFGIRIVCFSVQSVLFLAQLLVGQEVHGLVS